MNDLLTPLAAEIIGAATYDKLAVTSASPKAHELLDKVTPQDLVNHPISSLGHAYAMIAGLWLWHDELHECHEIAQMDADALHRNALNLHRKASKTSQNVHSVESVENDNLPNQQQLAEAATSLSFWHAIMHRLEGDYSNAKYWYDRCSTHRSMRLLGAVASDVVGTQAAKDPMIQHIVAGEWNPAALVDLVAAVHNKPNDPRFDAAVRLQQIEWQTLFRHCVYEAVGMPGE